MVKGKKIRAAHIHSDEDAVALMIMTAHGDSKHKDLMVDVICSAMQYLKTNPDKTVEEACTFGVDKHIAKD